MADPTGPLKELFACGVRLLLLVGGPDFVGAYAGAALVDRLLVDWLVVPDGSNAESDVVAPPRYRIEDVTRSRTGIRVLYVPDSVA
jgi:hypothetical protein